MLPGCGVVVEYEATPMAVAFMYLDAAGSGLAWLAWLATAPGAPPLRAGIAIDMAVTHLETLAKEMHYWLLMATYHHPSLVEMLQRNGFAIGDSGMTQLFKPLT